MESADRQLVKNTFLTGLAELSGGLLQLLLVLAAAWLGPQRFGSFQWALYLAWVLDIVTDLGLRLVCVRAVARDRSRARDYLVQALGLKLVLAAGYLLLLIPIAWLSGAGGDIFWVTLLLAVSMILRSFKFLARNFFQACGRFDLEALTCLLERALLFAGGVAVLWAGGGIVGLAAVFAASRLVDLAVTLAMTGRYIARPGLARPGQRWLALLREALPFGLTLGFLQLYFRVNLILLPLLWGWDGTGEKLAGLYGGGHNLIEALSALPRMLINVLFPALSALHLTSREQLLRVYRRGNRALLAAALLVAALFAVHPEVPLGLMGARFVPAAPAFRLLILSSVFLFLSYLGGVVLGAIDRQEINAWAGGAAVVAAVAAGLALIPEHGIVGAAAAALLSELVFFAVIYCWLAKLGYAAGYWLAFWRPGLAALAAAGLLLAARPHWPAAAALPAAAGLFGAVLLLSGGLRRRYLLPGEAPRSALPPRP